ncbi:hypothetical protein [Polymorphospora sp. NPDC050346]|uniref:hypothetical protein n=1 Tax=Polymorphospora sp. NPDC050346 TaxID=3155780 RepID=UPI0033C8CA92
MTTLAQQTGIGVDLGTAAWPTVEQDMPLASVVLVCRATAHGTWAATGAVEQWRRRVTGSQVRLLGVVAVAASQKRPPRIATERLQLLAGWAPNVWHIGWTEALLAADHPTDIGAHPPDVEHLRHTLAGAVHAPLETR